MEIQPHKPGDSKACGYNPSTYIIQCLNFNYKNKNNALSTPISTYIVEY